MPSLTRHLPSLTRHPSPAGPPSITRRPPVHGPPARHPAPSIRRPSPVARPFDVHRPSARRPAVRRAPARARGGRDPGRAADHWGTNRPNAGPGKPTLKGGPIPSLSMTMIYFASAR